MASPFHTQNPLVRNPFRPIRLLGWLVGLHVSVLALIYAFAVSVGVL